MSDLEQIDWLTEFADEIAAARNDDNRALATRKKSWESPAAANRRYCKAYYERTHPSTSGMVPLF